MKLEFMPAFSPCLPSVSELATQSLIDASTSRFDEFQAHLTATVYHYIDPLGSSWQVGYNCKSSSNNGFYCGVDSMGSAQLRPQSRNFAL